MVKVNKVGHVVLNVKDTEASVKFYTQALSMEVVSSNRERGMAFLSFGTQHHDIALFQAPEGAKPGDLGLNHIALQLQGGFAELQAVRQRLLDQGIRAGDLVDHGVTRSVYFSDPDGNGLEIFCEMFEEKEGLKYLRERGGFARATPVGNAPSR